jgi:hypothetical protein
VALARLADLLLALCAVFLLLLLREWSLQVALADEIQFWTGKKIQVGWGMGWKPVQVCAL